ncbi:hypothetical protein [Vibrio agarivorans]|uniref:hypothetical protein n=1 Tax=Vibrio agarivorans TaxID=153622 RepID=UPI0025B28D6B|nr:hypothetical protein [Vibrio agarivorans]MDN3659940.1 hypothetical protein [Vibrio agarivorans]
MAGINPTTGQWDPNYNPMQPQQFGSMYGGGNPADMYSANTLAQNTQPLQFTTQQQNNIANLPGNQSDSWFSFDRMFGGRDGQGNRSSGWVSPAIQGAGVLANSWLGFQGLGIAQDRLAMQQDAWALQRADYEYQRDRRDAQSAAYDEVRRGNTAGNL